LSYGLYPVSYPDQSVHSADKTELTLPKALCAVRHGGSFCISESNDPPHKLQKGSETFGSYVHKHCTAALIGLNLIRPGEVGVYCDRKKFSSISFVTHRQQLTLK
jgi:hypothetical protein